MSTLRTLGKTIPTGVVILSSMVVAMNMAQAQADSCLEVRGPKRARVLSKNCSPDSSVPGVHDNQQIPISKTKAPHDADQLSPEQSIQDVEGIGGGSLEQDTKPKVRFRGPKRGGYID